jgi:hypothetical protein
MGYPFLEEADDERSIGQAEERIKVISRER